MPSSNGLDFDTLYRAHLAFVCQRLRRWGVPARDLEDAAHDAFVVVHRRLPECTPDLPVRPWLAAIAYRVASDWRRRAFSRHVLMTDQVPEQMDDRMSSEQVAAQQQALRHMEQALEGLGEEQRMVFVLHDVEGHAAPELAKALRIPLNTVYSRLRLARQRFTLAMEGIRQEVQHVPAAV